MRSSRAIPAGAGAEPVPADRAPRRGGGAAWAAGPREALLRHPARALAAIVLCSVLFRLPGLDGTLTDMSSWRQTDTATIARNFLETPSILWPRIDWGAPGPGYVEAELQLYPFAVSLLYRLFGEDPLYGQLLSIALAAVSCLVVYRLARRFLSDGTALLAVALFAMAPIVFRYSRAFMPEATVLLLYLLALDRFLEFLDRRTWSNALWVGAFTGLAVLVKPTSVHIGLVFLVLLVTRDGWRALAGRQPLAIAALALLPAGAYYAHAANIHAVYGNTFGLISGGDSKWGSLEWWTNPRFWASLVVTDTAWMTGPVGAALCVYVLVRTRSRELRTLAIAWSVTLVVYYCIVARYAGDRRGLHYHIYAAPLFALLTAAGFGLLWQRWAGRRILLALALAGIVGFQLAMDGVILAWPRKDHLRAAGLKVAELSQPGDTVVVLSEDGALDGSVANNYEQPDVFFHARRRGRVLALDRQSARGLAAALDPDARWFVNFPGLNKAADPSYRTALDGMRRAHAGDGFEIYAVDARPDSGVTGRENEREK